MVNVTAATTAAAAKQRSIKHRIEVITPEIATSWLEKNEANRNVQQGTVERYARDMKAGRWHLTGDPIQFGISGRLLNGQHRLWACVLADVSFESLIVRGLVNEQEIMDVIDTGRKRTLGNALQIYGEKDAALLAAIVNTCWRYERGNIRGERSVYPTHEEGLAWLAENPEARQAPVIGRRAYGATRVHLSTAASAYHLNARRDAEAAELFWTKVATGEDLKAGDPILAYRRWISTTVAKRDKPTADLWLFHALKAMNVWRCGRSIRVFQFRNDEDVPALWS